MTSNFYSKTAPTPIFKDYCNEHKKFMMFDSIDRTVYKITDLQLWFESHFEYGEELTVMRVSYESQYDFTRIGDM